MKMKNLLKYLLIFIFCLSVNAFASQEGLMPVNVSPKTLQLENEFIKIIVNNMDSGNFAAVGRFALETTSGDPKNVRDDNQPLIYGRPFPWTSYTSFKIDDKVYVFGGENKKIQKRTGSKIVFGQLISQELVEDTVITECLFGDVRIIQTLKLFRNSWTKVRDTAMISYEVINESNITSSVGVRIMLDTKLGKNDGAPFRIGEKAVVSERKFVGTDIFDYWQTFDDLASPNVIAQGTVNDLENGIVQPDRIYLANWGTLADNAWDFSYEEDRSFIRLGEFEKDTALALYWDSKDIKPSESVTYKTLYGLGGVSLAPGELSLGITAPAEVYASSKKELLVIGYILNAGGFDSKATKAKFVLPKGFKVVSGKVENDIGLLAADEMVQIPIKIKIVNARPGIRKLGLEAVSETLDANKILRKIEILALPTVQATLEVPKEKDVSIDGYVKANLRLKNTTKLALNNVRANIRIDEALQVPSFEIKSKDIESIKPGETVDLDWQLKVKKAIDKKIEISADISTKLGKPKTVKAYCELKEPSQNIVVKLSSEDNKIKVNDFFYFDFILQNAEIFKDYDVSLIYNNDFLQFGRLSKASWVRETNQSEKIKKEPNRIIISGLDNAKKELERKICKAHFKAMKTGETEVIFKVNGEIVKVLSLRIE
jgi:hypothetical protein